MPMISIGPIGKISQNIHFHHSQFLMVSLSLSLTGCCDRSNCFLRSHNYCIVTLHPILNTCNATALVGNATVLIPTPYCGSFISPPLLKSLRTSPEHFSSTLLDCWIFLEITKDSKRFYDFPKNSISWKESILLMWGHLWQCIWLGEFNMCVSICIGMYLIGTFFLLILLVQQCNFKWFGHVPWSSTTQTRNTNYNPVSTLLTQLVSKGLFNSSLDRSLLSRIGACSVSKLPHWDVSVSADDQFRGKKRADL